MKKRIPTLKIKDLVLLKTNPQEYYRKHLEDSKSYSHKPHLGSLPHDRRTNDPEKLQERIDAIDERLKDTDSNIKDVEHELDYLIGDKKKEYEQNIKEAEDEVNSKNEEISNLSEDYISKLTDSIDLWDEFYGGVSEGEIDISPNLQDIGDEDWDESDYEGYEEKVMEQTMDDLAEIGNKVDWYRDADPNKLMQPEMGGAFEEAIRNLRTLDYDLDQFFDLHDEFGEDEKFLYTNLFNESADILDEIKEAQHVIDMDTKFIKEQTEALNEVSLPSANGQRRIINLNNKLDKLHRERQDYLDERERTETKKDKVSKN